MKKFFTITILLSFIISGIQCSVYETLTNLSRLQFKVGAVNGFQISGTPFSGKSKLGDFNPVDLLKISSAFAQGSLPASFILNVEAKNPNDGTGDVTIIPLRINIDLMKFFKDKDYESIVNLALALGGAQGSSSKITLFATPTVSSPFGNIAYTGELKLVDYEFSK